MNFVSVARLEAHIICNLRTLIQPKDVLLNNEDVTSHDLQSEQELINMKKYFKDLPLSPPLTILSDEKWYPYSQYEFHRDGSSYADSAERKSIDKTVPEVLSIDLPTGFDASHFSHFSSPPPPPPPPDSSGFRSTPTVVDFPSTPPSSSKTTSEEKEDPNLKQGEEERCVG